MDTMISQIPFLEILQEHVLEQLSSHTKHRTYESGATILSIGEASHQLFMIISGAARVYLPGVPEVELAVLKKGQFFGEMSCLTGDPVSASIDAVGSLETVTISKEGIMLLMNHHEQFRTHILEALIIRIRQSNNRVADEHIRSTVLIQQQLTEQQEQLGELTVHSEKMRVLMERLKYISTQAGIVVITGERGTGKRNLAYALHQMHSKELSPFIVVDGEQFTQTLWETQYRAAGHGTIVLDNAEFLEHEALSIILEQIPDQSRVVLTATPLFVTQQLQKYTHHNIHIVEVPPLRERVEDIPALIHSFVRKAGYSDAESLFSREAIRMMTLYPYLKGNIRELLKIVQDALVLSEGRTVYTSHLRFGSLREPGERPTIGLALGSGSLRGISHLGVLKVFEQSGIPIDMIAGTSVGSLVGGAYAAGVRSDELIKIVSSMTWKNIAKFTLPKQSLMQNNPLKHFIESHLGQLSIEELPMPFAAVASDTATGEAHIMRSGSLAHAIAASTAIPAVMKPVSFQGKQLIDGAVVHPVPAALVKSMGADIVIAVDVSAVPKGVPANIFEALLNTIDLMSTKIVSEELQLANIVLRPDLQHIQVNFKNSPALIASGEQVAFEAMQNIQQLIQNA